MTLKNNFTLFNELRQEFDFLKYESFEIVKHSDKLDFSFCFNLSGKVLFNASYSLPFNCFINVEKLYNTNLIENIIFNIGMSELVSYWKAACPREVIIKPAFLNNEQIEWWKNLYYNGLGEFFWLNNIKTSKDEFMHISSNSIKSWETDESEYANNLLVPVGGGKDSVVSLELLKKNKNVIPFAINPRGAIFDTLKSAGFEENQLFIINRYLDKQLLDLNSKGYLNGHTPFSSVVAFNTLLAAHLTNSKYIALSNESSANESTVPGSDINHQYSKSIYFERDFRYYVNKNISKELNYFSFLRPLSELQIAKLFSKYKNHYFTFKSCNVGSKTDSWCGKCPKCLFTYIILSPFIKQETLEKIFDKNIFNDIELKNELDKLIGIADVKPFECVGTIEEVNIALSFLLNQKNVDKSLLMYYNNINIFDKYIKLSEYDFKNFNEENFLPGHFKVILKNALDEIC